MTDVAKREDNGIDGTTEIGLTIVEMTKRVRVCDKFAPGTVARWAFELDGCRFDVTVAAQRQPGSGEDA